MVKRRAKIYAKARLDELPTVGRYILRLCRSGKHVVAFSGSLGAGKSTLIRALGRELGIQRLPSPTYVLVRHARPRTGSFQRLVHADLYRLPRGADLLALGLSEDLEDVRTLVLVEWPERATKFHPDIRVRLSGVGDERTIRIR